MSETPTASPVVLGRWEKPGNLASIAALAAAGQVTILPHELIRTTDGRVYHWTTSALEIVSAPVHHGAVSNVAALDGIYLLPSCTRGVHPGDTAYVTAASCEYRVTSGINATAAWSACATLPTIPTTPSEVGADPAGTASTAVSTHNTATDSHADIREILAGKQAAGSYLTTTGTAADSAKLGGRTPEDYAITTHEHTSFSGSLSVSGPLVSRINSYNYGAQVSAAFTYVPSGAVTAIATNPTGGGSVGGMYFIVGDNGYDGFCDQIVFVFSSPPTVLHSATAYGSPPARVYSNNVNSLNLYFIGNSGQSMNVRAIYLGFSC